MSEIEPRDRETFNQAFLMCLLSSTSDEDNEFLDHQYDLADIDSGTVAGLAQQCNAFLDANAADIQALVDQIPGYTFSSAGYDFALSRNGHGAGFFDREVNEPSERLQKAAEAAGPAEAYVGDDGMVYVLGLEPFQLHGQQDPSRSTPRP